MHLQKTLITLSIIVLLLAGAAGAAYSGMMMGHSVEDMVGCSLVGHSATVCNMDSLEHLTQWQNLFAATLGQNAVLLLLAFLALCFFFLFNQYLRLAYPSPQPVYISYDSEVAIHDPLRRFIARGLMHPKFF